MFKRKNISERTKYDLVKRTKRDNFTFLSKGFCKEGQTVLAGDSITEIFNVTDLFADYTERTGLAVYNRGISGDTSDRLLERFHDNVLSISPKNIVLLIGTNDIGLSADTPFILGNVSKIIAMIKDECPQARIILQAIYPVNKKVKCSAAHLRSNKAICEANAELKALANREGITYADFTELLSDENGDFKAEYTYDGLHPNAVGFSVVAKELKAILESE